MKAQTPSRPMKILLGFDGSLHAKAAVKLLCDLPLSPGSITYALAVFPHRQTSDHDPLRTSLKETVSCLTDRGLQAFDELVVGYPAEKLIERAEQLNPDLILIGARGLRSTLGILLGGVAQSVVELATWPVLVVREPYEGIRNVLLVTDGSEFSQCAEAYISQFPWPEDINLRVLNVMPPILDPEDVALSWPMGVELDSSALPRYTPEMRAQWQAEEETNAHRILDESQQRLAAAGMQAMTITRQGDAATEIIEYVKAESIDLIVAGSRGLGTFKSWLLGSVSRKLIHYSDTSVLIVKSSLPTP